MLGCWELSWTLGFPFKREESSIWLLPPPPPLAKSGRVELRVTARGGVGWAGGSAGPTSPASRDPGWLELDGTPEMTQPSPSSRKPGN